MEESKLSLQPLDTENCGLWKPRMEVALEHKGLWEYVENNLDKDGDAKADRTARGFKVVNVKEHHLSTPSPPANRQTAKQAWDALART